MRMRFAPSPTGYLHVGGARTALFNWLLARKHGGAFILRIEDTDQTRHVADSLEKILADLRWLGITWDEGPEAGGEAGPYFQSERLDVYRRYTQQLLESGHAYYAMETTEQLAAMREQAPKGTFKYRRPDPLPTVAQGEAARAVGHPVGVRCKMPEEDITVHDQVLGDVELRRSELEDFVIQKADGWPTYHFACVVDDELMGVTHVLRGQEHLINTPKHVALQRALGFRTPVYAHLPLIDNLSGRKMSKRDKPGAVRDVVKVLIRQNRWTLKDLAVQAGGDEATAERWLGGADAEMDLAQLKAVASRAGVTIPEIDVHDFRVAGYLPEALINFVSLLGWSTGDDTEHMTLEETIRRFSVEAIGRSSAKFDRDKLLAFNTDWAQRVAPARLLVAFKDFLRLNESRMGLLPDETLAYVLRITKGFRTFRDVEFKAGALFAEDEAIVYDPKAVRKVLHKNEGQGFAMLEAVLPRLESLAEWTAAALESCIAGFCAEQNCDWGTVAQPLRVAIMGTTISPPIHDTLFLAGKAGTLRRIQRALALKQQG